MKKDILCIFLVMIVVAMGGIDILGKVRVFEPLGQEIEVLVNVNNPTDTDMDELNVRAIFFANGEVIRSKRFDLDDGETKSVILRSVIRDLTGYSLIKVTASNDDYFDSKYMYVNVR